MKYILKGTTTDCDSYWWKAKLSALIGTTFTKDESDVYWSEVTGDFYPTNWLNLQTEIDYLIEQRGDLSARIEELDSQRYYQEVKNDVLNLDDRYQFELAEWLNEVLKIEIAKDNEWNNDN